MEPITDKEMLRSLIKFLRNFSGMRKHVQDDVIHGFEKRLRKLNK